MTLDRLPGNDLRTSTSPGIAMSLLALGLTIFLGFALGTRLVDRHLIIMFIAMVVIAYLLGQRAKSEHDEWLPRVAALGMVAKLIGASMRYYVLVEVYNRSGDATRYNNFAVGIAETWRDLQIPDLATVGFGSEGTRFTAWVTGLLYAPYQPSFQGGFWIYAFLAFLGQLLLYLAFRKSVSSRRWRLFAILIFFWPTLVYWPSSIGKESLIMLFLGMGAWAAAHLFQDYRLRWLPLIAGSAFLISMVRVHVAALFVGSLLLAALLAKRRQDPTLMMRRMVVVLIGVAALVPLALGVGDRFELDIATLGADDIDPFFDDVGATTQQGGSAVSGGVIRSPLDIPGAILKVLFRPLPTDADNVQMLASSVEGLMLLGLLVWNLPSMVRNRRMIRESPYVLFSLIYTSLFIWAWSAILNLGILARQRSLVIPFVLVLVAALGHTHDNRQNVLEEQRIVGRDHRRSWTVVAPKSASEVLFEQQAAPEPAPEPDRSVA